MHTDRAFRTYLGWYQQATHIKLCQWWTNDDYADGGSSNNEDTVYDAHTREGSTIEQGPILDRVVCYLATLLCFYNDVSFYSNMDCCRVSNADDL
jgi:hypothetical protein